MACQARFPEHLYRKNVTIVCMKKIVFEEKKECEICNRISGSWSELKVTDHLGWRVESWEIFLCLFCSLEVPLEKIQDKAKTLWKIEEKRYFSVAD